jgi:hypothetical protein
VKDKMNDLLKGPALGLALTAAVHEMVTTPAVYRQLLENPELENTVRAIAADYMLEEDLESIVQFLLEA